MFMLYLFLKLIRKIEHVGVELGVVKMFVNIVLINPYEIITRPLGEFRGLKAYVTC